ncbi:MAG: hypothetical protein WBM78_16165 [Desulfobacterales bacterium]
MQKIIKAGHDTVTPGVGQINFDPLAQKPVPVTLPGALNAGDPSICGCFADDAGSDRLNRSLKTLKIPFGSQSDHTTTIRTAITFQKQWPYEPIKNCLCKTMSPQSPAVTAWATGGLLPWVITFFFEKFLEFDSRKEYHFLVPCGLHRPTSSQGRQYAYFNPPPLLFKIKKASNLRPIYSDNHLLLVN